MKIYFGITDRLKIEHVDLFDEEKTIDHADRVGWAAMFSWDSESQEFKLERSGSGSVPDCDIAKEAFIYVKAKFTSSSSLLLHLSKQDVPDRQIYRICQPGISGTTHYVLTQRIKNRVRNIHILNEAGQRDLTQVYWTGEVVRFQNGRELTRTTPTENGPALSDGLLEQIIREYNPEYYPYELCRGL